MAGDEPLLVADGDAARWGLLAVARQGDRALLHDLDGTADTIWTSRRPLPAADHVGRVAARTIVIRDPEGRLYRFDLASERLSESDRVPGDARWSVQGDYGTWIHPESGRMWQMGADGFWSYGLRDSLLWAGAAANGDVLALVGSADSSSLWRYERGAEEPLERRRVGLSPPAVVTAWGQLLAATRIGDGARVVELLDTSDLQSTGRVEVGGAVTALAASPSSHELYVGVDGGSPHLVVVNRFSLEPQRRVELPGRVEQIRTSALGGPPLVRTPTGVFLVPWDGDTAESLEVVWRDDLPLSLPDGSVVGVRNGRVLRMDPTGGSGATVGTELGSADRWWLPVRWRPPRAVAGERVAAAESAAIGPAPSRGDSVPGRQGRDTTALAAGGDVRPSPMPSSAGSETTGAAGEAGGAGQAGRVDRVGEARDESFPTGEPGREPRAAGGPRPGFYAVVVAARNRDGVERLTAELARAGYPTAVQRHRDDAGRLWFRGLVGPFPERAGAEGAARRLQSERDLSVWIKELAAGGGSP